MKIVPFFTSNMIVMLFAPPNWLEYLLCTCTNGWRYGSSSLKLVNISSFMASKVMNAVNAIVTSETHPRLSISQSPIR